MNFERVFIMGSGSIAVNIAKSLLKDGIKPIILLYKEHSLSMLSRVVDRENLSCQNFNDKNQAAAYLQNISSPSLIISANNIYLFPPQVVAKPNLKIVNFHNALLPHHRGMNAPTWTIYEGDACAGLTWHLVTPGIDDGDIIMQKKFSLNGSENALFIIQKLMRLALEAFEEIKTDLLNWQLNTTPMPQLEKPQIHYSRDIPNNGILDLTWNISQISAFLRALDWGAVRQFPKPLVTYNHLAYEVGSYQLQTVAVGPRQNSLDENILTVTENGISLKIKLNSLEQTSQKLAANSTPPPKIALTFNGLAFCCQLRIS